MASATAEQGMAVVVLTGRRVDAADSKTPRFPLAHVDIVKARMRRLFQRLNAQALVCSAACGADLLALTVARELQMQEYVVLPFDREAFRESSVVDRPGAWAPLYDELLDDAERAGRLHIMKQAGSNHDAYLDAVTAMLDQAAILSRLTVDRRPAAISGPITAVAVWNGESRGSRDVTVFFIAEAKKRGFAARSIGT